MAHSVVLVDLDAGNVRSVSNALAHLGIEHTRARTAADVATASHIILPGVGAYGAFMQKLRERGLDDALTHATSERGAALLGICVGMQVLGSRGYEFGETLGFDWIAGDCVYLEEAARAGLPVPHTGWNTVQLVRPDPLFDGLGDRPTFYFVHSFHLVPHDEQVVLATVHHGAPVAAAIGSGRVRAVQFHPEKSQHAGLRLLRNFVRMPL